MSRPRPGAGGGDRRRGWGAELLDEIHWLIENTRLRFVLCGSSTRKLKRGRGNLLGGRATRYELHPLVYPEIPDFDLETALNEVAVEAKGVPSTESHHLHGLRAIGDEYRFRRRILVSCDPRRRMAEGGIEIVPWRDFLEELWSGGVMS